MARRPFSSARGIWPATVSSAFPAGGGHTSGPPAPPPPASGDILPITLAVSVVAHALVLLITFAPPGSDGSKFVPHLDVVLVNSKSASKPAQADGPAQPDLDGGGDTEADRPAKTNLPKLNNVEPPPNVQLAAKQVRQLETEAH